MSVQDVGESPTHVRVKRYERISGMEAADDVIRGMVELHLVVGRAGETHELTRRSLRIAQVVQPSDSLELPFGWDLALLEDRTGLLDDLELGLELFDAPTGANGSTSRALDP